MTIIDAIILGIFQGITEFLPVSSSGHNEIIESILKINAYENNLLTITVLHAATALSTIVIFKKEFYETFLGFLMFNGNNEFKFSVKIIISMIPAVILGLFFEKRIDLLFQNNLLLVGIMLIVTGILLFLSDKKIKTDKGISFKSAFIIGLAQSIAILPGLSRSGSTISTAIFLGIDKKLAAKFSFMMVVPLILGKMIKDIYELKLFNLNEEFTPLFFGFLSAFFTGLISCSFMIKLVQKSKLWYFSVYCFIMGFICFIKFY